MHYAFVILHYLTYKDTVECVESILENITNAEYSIIIVDNGSNNESGDQLQKKYAENNESRRYDVYALRRAGGKRPDGFRRCESG